MGTQFSLDPTMIAIAILFALIATALAQTTAGGKACTQANTDEIQKCADTYTKCAQDNATVDGVCTCLGEYKSCADKISCDGPVAKGIRDGLGPGGVAHRRARARRRAPLLSRAVHPHRTRW